MAVHFALRSRIRLDPEPPTRKRELDLPPLTVPVFLYWGLMGALTWGVFTGSLRLEGLLAPAREPAATDWAGVAEPTAAAPRAATAEPVPPADLEPAPVAPSDAPPLAPAPDVAGDEPPPQAASADRTVRSIGVPSLEMARLTPKEPERARNDSPAPAAPEPDEADEPAPSGGLPSCEAAAASAGDTYDLSAPSGSRTPDVTRDTYAGILENGAYLASCDVPASTRVGVCVAVKDGRATGITVTLQPGNDRVRACVTRAVQKLRFPASPRLDVTRTTFDAAR